MLPALLGLYVNADKFEGLRETEPAGVDFNFKKSISR
jgi:hypothetical protein